MRRIALLLSFLATPAFAQQTPPVPAVPLDPSKQQALATVVAEPVALMIAAFDQDGDARVTRAEFDAGLARSFASVDKQATGSIGYIAFADWAERWLGDRAALPSPFDVDRDGDNRITPTELATKFDEYFVRFDKDKDGAITRAELMTIRIPPMTDRRRR